MKKDSTLGLINETPLVKLDKIKSSGEIYAKLEFLQPGGSIKDRVAKQIIADAYRTHKLVKAQAVVEMTSGNMGAGLAVVCRQYGNPFIAVMSEGNSPERRKILKALGAEVVLIPQVDGEPGMVTGNDIRYAAEMARKITAEKNGYYVDQFNSSSCIRAHFCTTGPEILDDLKDTDVFIACIGTGGTFTGTSLFLKSRNSNIKCIAVEPANASVLKTGKVNDPKHIIQGTGYGFVPPLWKPGLADDIITVTDNEVREMTRMLSEEQGLYTGYSSGANVAAAVKYLSDAPGKKVVTVLCDYGYKYSDL